MNANELLCKNCNAELIVGTSSIPTVCVFCGGKISPSDAQPISCDFSASLISPFSQLANARVLSDIAFEWLINIDNTPDDVLENASFNALYGMFVPLWVFSGKYIAHWNASSGYYRTEHYTAYETRHENGRRKQVKVTKTRTVTDWKPASGKSVGEFYESGMDAKIFENNLLNFCEGARIERESVVKFDAIHIEGYRLKPFYGIEPDEAYEMRVKQKVNSSINRNVKDSVPGDTAKDIKWDADISIKSKIPIYYPYWVAQMDYGDKGYLILIDGSDISRIGGNYPMESVAKRKDKFKYSFAPFRLSIVSLFATVAAIILVSGKLGHNRLELVLKIFIPIIVVTYIYGAIRNKLIRKAQNEYRKNTLFNAKREKSFVFGV